MWYQNCFFAFWCAVLERWKTIDQFLIISHDLGKFGSANNIFWKISTQCSDVIGFHLRLSKRKIEIVEYEATKNKQISWGLEKHVQLEHCNVRYKWYFIEFKHGMRSLENTFFMVSIQNLTKYFEWRRPNLGYFVSKYIFLMCNTYTS